MGIPTLETERLELREISMDDLEAYRRYFVDYEVIRFLSVQVPWPYPESGIEDFLRDFIIPNQGRNRWMWGLYLKSKPDEMIGGIDLWREGKPENRGFWLGRKFWSNGYMSEAAEAVNSYAFRELGFDKLIYSNAVGNFASRRVKEKTGARFIKRHEMNFVDPQFTQAELWELTKEDWLKSNSEELA